MQDCGARPGQQRDRWAKTVLCWSFLFCTLQNIPVLGVQYVEPWRSLHIPISQFLLGVPTCGPPREYAAFSQAGF